MGDIFLVDLEVDIERNFVDEVPKYKTISNLSHIWLDWLELGSRIITSKLKLLNHLAI